jgi:hypothetical protein
MRRRSAPPIRLFDVVPSEVVQAAKRLAALLVPSAARRNLPEPDGFRDAITTLTTPAGPFTSN